MTSRYRRALSNNCTEGTLLQFSPRRQKCPSQAPRGLQLFTSEGTLVATLERNVTFLVFLEEVLTWLSQSNSTVYYGLHAFFLSVIMCLSRCFRRRSTEAGARACQVKMQWQGPPLDLVLVDIMENALCSVSARTPTNIRGCAVSDWVLFSFSKGLSSTTSITVDFGDGTAISYVNISSIEDGVKHIYSKVGIYQVSATATNMLGFDRVILYLHVTCESRKNPFIKVSAQTWTFNWFFNVSTWQHLFFHYTFLNSLLLF